MYFPTQVWDFSVSFWYYHLIRGVHRLQIASLTLMKDHERLDLLKEIGGTRVYEERRKESLKIMVDTGKQQIFLRQQFKRVYVFGDLM